MAIDKFQNGIKGFFDGFMQLLFPHSCIQCEGVPDRRDGFLCESCREDIIWIGKPHCSRCGIPFEADFEYPTEKFECSSCRLDPPSFHRARALALYQGPMRELIRQFKYGCQLGMMREFAVLLKEYCRIHGLNNFTLVPVPLHVRRMKERGFDQAFLIAREIAEAAGLPLAEDGLERIIDTPPQVRLNRTARRKNVRGAFRANDPDRFKGQRVLLIDDVLTTGATAHEAARVLKKAKASEVHVLTLARAVTDY